MVRGEEKDIFKFGTVSAGDPHKQLYPLTLTKLLDTLLAFSPAIIVTPLGAVSVVVSAILSIVFLSEKLNFSGSMGILLCIIGSVFIVLHAPPSTQTETLPEFFSYVLSPGFLVYSFFAVAVLCYLVFRLGPLYGSTQPIIYLSITSLGGAFLVNAAQGLGSSIVYSISSPEDSQFKHWAMYPLMAFTLFCAIFQVNFLNKSLQHFSTSIVTPVNYVFFSTATLITSAVLFGGFNVSGASDAIQIIMGFLVIVIGVSLLFQYHLKLNKLEKARAEAALEVGDGCLRSLNTSSEESVDVNVPISASAIDDGDPRLSLSDPRTDINPVTLWKQTFPLHQRLLRRLTNPKKKNKDQTAAPTVTSIARESRTDSTTIQIDNGAAPEMPLPAPVRPVVSPPVPPKSDLGD